MSLPLLGWSMPQIKQAARQRTIDQQQPVQSYKFLRHPHSYTMDVPKDSELPWKAVVTRLGRHHSHSNGLMHCSRAAPYAISEVRAGRVLGTASCWVGVCSAHQVWIFPADNMSV